MDGRKKMELQVVMRKPWLFYGRPESKNELLLQRSRPEERSSMIEWLCQVVGDYSVEDCWLRLAELNGNEVSEVILNDETIIGAICLSEMRLTQPRK